MRLVRKLGLAVCLLPLLMGASVYRWVDENGVVNYTQLKPEGVEAELVHADTGQRIPGARPPAAAGAAAAAAAPRAEPPLTENQQKMLADLKAAEAARQQEIAKVREANCREAHALLQRLTARGRIRVKGEDGVERAMSEEERQQRIDQAQRAVAANCAETASR